MTFELFVPILLRCGILLVLTAALVWLLLRLTRCRSAKIHRIAWFIVLFQGILLFSWPVKVPVLEPVEIIVHEPIAFEPQLSEEPQLPELPERPLIHVFDTVPRYQEFRYIEPVTPPILPETLPEALPKYAMPVVVREVDTMPEPIVAEDVFVPMIEDAPVSWSAIAFGVWISGVLALLGFKGFVYFRLLRTLGPQASRLHLPLSISGQASSLHGARENTMQTVPDRTQAGGTPAVPGVLLTDQLGPALARLPGGYAILVPKSLWEEAGEDIRRGILLHELSHYRHHDGVKSFFAWLLTLTQWFNPAAWYALKRFHDAAEWRCDAEAYGHQDGSVARFAESMLMLHKTSDRYVGVLQTYRNKELMERIEKLTEFQNQRKESPMKHFCLLTCFLFLFAVGVVRIELVAKDPVSKSEPQTPVHETATTDVVADDIDNEAELSPEMLEMTSRYRYFEAKNKHDEYLANSHPRQEKELQHAQKIDELENERDSALQRWRQAYVRLFIHQNPKPNMITGDRQLDNDLRKYIRESLVYHEHESVLKYYGKQSDHSSKMLEAIQETEAKVAVAKERFEKQKEILSMQLVLAKARVASCTAEVAVLEKAVKEAKLTPDKLEDAQKHLALMEKRLQIAEKCFNDPLGIVESQKIMADSNASLEIEYRAKYLSAKSLYEQLKSQLQLGNGKVRRTEELRVLQEKMHAALDDWYQRHFRLQHNTYVDGLMASRTSTWIGEIRLKKAALKRDEAILKVLQEKNQNTPSVTSREVEMKVAIKEEIKSVEDRMAASKDKLQKHKTFIESQLETVKSRIKASQDEVATVEDAVKKGITTGDQLDDAKRRLEFSLEYCYGIEELLAVMFDDDSPEIDTAAENTSPPQYEATTRNWYFTTRDKLDKYLADLEPGQENEPQHIQKIKELENERGEALQRWRQAYVRYFVHQKQKPRDTSTEKQMASQMERQMEEQLHEFVEAKANLKEAQDILKVLQQTNQAAPAMMPLSTKLNLEKAGYEVTLRKARLAQQRELVLAQLEIIKKIKEVIQKDIETSPKSDGQLPMLAFFENLQRISERLISELFEDGGPAKNVGVYGEAPYVSHEQAAEQMRIIQEKLDEPFLFDFKDATTFANVLQQLQKETGIKVGVDGRLMTVLPPDTPAKLRLPSPVPLRDALRYLGKQLNIDWVIRDGVLLITTPAHAKGQRFVVNYYVGDLLKRSTPALSTNGEKPPLEEGAFDTIVDYIKTMVPRDSWKNVDDDIMRYYPNTSLVIRQTEETHEQISELLKNLRRYNDVQISFDIKFLSLDEHKFSNGAMELKQRFIAFSGEKQWTYSPGSEGSYFVQITPHSGKPIPAELAAKNEPLSFVVPKGGQWTIQSKAMTRDGADIVTATLLIDGKAQKTVTFYASPIPDPEELPANFRRPQQSLSPREEVVSREYDVSDLLGKDGTGANEIVSLITDVTGDDWTNDKRVSIAVENTKLIVVQTPSVHAEIVDLFRQLRALNHLQVRFEVSVLRATSGDAGTWNSHVHTTFNGQTKDIELDADTAHVVRIRPEESTLLTEDPVERKREILVTVPKGTKLSVRGIAASDRKYVRLDVSIDDKQVREETFHAEPILKQYNVNDLVTVIVDKPMGNFYPTVENPEPKTMPAIKFTLTCMVTEITEDGRLHLSGVESMELGGVKSTVFVSGIVRPERIQDGQVNSDRIENLQIKVLPVSAVRAVY